MAAGRRDTAEFQLSDQPETGALRLSDAAFAAVEIGIGVIDAAARYVKVNAAFARFHGFQAGDMLGQECAILLPGREGAEAHLPDAVPYSNSGAADSGAPITEARAERRILRPDGTTVDVLVTVAPLDRETWPGASVITLTDISARKRAEAELRQALAAAEAAKLEKSVFLANLSHELRTPMNAVMAFSEILVTQALGPMRPAGYRTYAEDVQASGRHLLDVVGDMLDIAKLQARQFGIKEADLDLDLLVGEIAGAVEKDARQPDVTIESSVEWPVGVVRFDPQLLQRLLRLTVGFSIRESRAGGNIRVGAFPLPDGRCLVSVSGAGTASASRFAEEILRSRPGGPVPGGLAIPLAAAIAESHGGEFFVNAGPGAGSTLNILLPITRVRRRRLIAVDCVFRVRNRPHPISCANLDADELERLAGAVVRLDPMGGILEVQPVPGSPGVDDAPTLVGRNLFEEVAPSLRATPIPDQVREGIVERDLDIVLVVPSRRRPDRLLHCEARRGAEPGEARLVVRRI